MHFPLRFRRQCQLVAWPVLLVGTLAAAPSLEQARESMLDNSPFVPWAPAQTVEPPPPPPVAAPGPLSREIEFNGVISIGEQTYFSIFDKSLNQSLLLGLDQPGARFTVVGFQDQGDLAIQVKAGTRVEQIPIQSPDGVPIATLTPSPVRPEPVGRVAPTPRIQPDTAQRTAPVVPRRRIIPRRRVANENNDG